jgi:hypothetical protein
MPQAKTLKLTVNHIEIGIFQKYRYRSGFHRTRYKVDPLLPPPSIVYSLSDLQTIREERKNANMLDV